MTKVYEWLAKILHMTNEAAKLTYWLFICALLLIALSIVLTIMCKKKI
jgi:hypothetical protein